MNTENCVHPPAYVSAKRQDRCIVPHCGKSLPPRRRRYCSNECAIWWPNNHYWTMAAGAAMKHNREVNSIAVKLKSWNGHEFERIIACCSRCHKPPLGEYEEGVTHREALDSRLEIDHIIPLNGSARSTTCLNHQENLRVVCHKCHLELTREQRKSGLIGRKT